MIRAPWIGLICYVFASGVSAETSVPVPDDDAATWENEGSVDTAEVPDAPEGTEGQQALEDEPMDASPSEDEPRNQQVEDEPMDASPSEAADLPEAGAVDVQSLEASIAAGEEQFGGCQTSPHNGGFLLLVAVLSSLIVTRKRRSASGEVSV